jgi:hypothetical protein
MWRQPASQLSAPCSLQAINPPLPVLLLLLRCSCVHLAVSTAALSAIQQLLQMLQQVAAGVAAASSDNDALQQDGADAAAAAAQLQAANSDEAAASSMQEASSTALVTGAAEPEEAGATAAPAVAAQAAEAEAPAAAEQPPLAAAERDASTSAAPAAAAAAVDAAAAAAGLTGAEVLFAGILESSSLQEGLRFAQAATAEALGDSSGGPERMFHLAHLCLLWQKAPEYAAAQQRQARGLGDDVPEAEVLMPGVPLDAGVRRDVQVSCCSTVVLRQQQLLLQVERTH